VAPRTTIIAVRITLAITRAEPGHHPRERIGRIDRIWGLILGGVGGSSPIAFPSVLVDHEYQKNRKNRTFKNHVIY